MQSEIDILLSRRWAGQIDGTSIGRVSITFFRDGSVIRCELSIREENVVALYNGELRQLDGLIVFNISLAKENSEFSQIGEFSLESIDSGEARGAWKMQSGAAGVLKIFGFETHRTSNQAVNSGELEAQTEFTRVIKKFGHSRIYLSELTKIIERFDRIFGEDGQTIVEFQDGEKIVRQTEQRFLAEDKSDRSCSELVIERSAGEKERRSAKIQYSQKMGCLVEVAGFDGRWVQHVANDLYEIASKNQSYTLSYIAYSLQFLGIALAAFVYVWLPELEIYDRIIFYVPSISLVLFLLLYFPYINRNRVYFKNRSATNKQFWLDKVIIPAAIGIFILLLNKLYEILKSGGQIF